MEDTSHGARPLRFSPSLGKSRGQRMERTLSGQFSRSEEVGNPNLILVKYDDADIDPDTAIH